MWQPRGCKVAGKRCQSLVCLTSGASGRLLALVLGGFRNQWVEYSVPVSRLDVQETKYPISHGIRRQVGVGGSFRSLVGFGQQVCSRGPCSTGVDIEHMYAKRVTRDDRVPGWWIRDIGVEPQRPDPWEMRQC